MRMPLFLSVISIINKISFITVQFKILVKFWYSYKNLWFITIQLKIFHEICNYLKSKLEIFLWFNDQLNIDDPDDPEEFGKWVKKTFTNSIKN